MTWIIITLPLMLLAIAIATVPVLVTMVRDDRARRADAIEAQASALARVSNVHADYTDVESDRELIAA
ncbi:MAG: hypothetical protein ACLPQS_02285 [Acidimicrobiales bacterium]|jgi:flagellar basal body-associated protein FliL